jgi:hypothetical protein
MSGAEFIAVLKEYGLAGVMAWLFWWTLRRMMASHDATVSQLKGQLAAESEAFREAGESFGKLVENHMTHVIGAIERFDASLTHHADDQRRWQDRFLTTLDKIAERLGAERSRA